MYSIPKHLFPPPNFRIAFAKSIPQTYYDYIYVPKLDSF